MNTTIESNDEHLIRRLLGGHEDAFTAIYRDCSGPVYRFALHMTGDSHAAEEITQETFLFLLANASSYQPVRGSLLSWLLGIARNGSRRVLGSTMETEPLDQADCDCTAEDNLFGEFNRRELIETVRRAIGSLPASLREVVILCELQELDYREAASALACPVGTVRSRLHRARVLLAAKLRSRCLV